MLSATTRSARIHGLPGILSKGDTGAKGIGRSGAVPAHVRHRFSARHSFSVPALSIRPFGLGTSRIVAGGLWDSGRRKYRGDITRCDYIKRIQIGHIFHSRARINLSVSSCQFTIPISLP